MASDLGASPRFIGIPDGRERRYAVPRKHRRAPDDGDTIWTATDHATSSQQLTGADGLRYQAVLDMMYRPVEGHRLRFVPRTDVRVWDEITFPHFYPDHGHYHDGWGQPPLP